MLVKWNKEDIDYITNCENLSMYGALLKFPYRNENSIKVKCWKLNIKIRCLNIEEKEHVDSLNLRESSYDHRYNKEKNILQCNICKESKEMNDSNFSKTENAYLGYFNICKDCQFKNMIINSYIKKFNIKLDFVKMFNTYTVIQWYEWFLERKIKMMPKPLMNDNKWFEVIRYAITEKLNLITRDEICTVQADNLSQLRINYKGKENTNSNLHSLYEMIAGAFPEHNYMPWELSEVPNHYFKDINNVRFVVDFMVNKYNITIESILNDYCYFHVLLNNNGLSGLLGITSSFRNYQDLFIWYYGEKGIKISYHDFKHKVSNYWKNILNADYQMTLYINRIISQYNISDYKNNLPNYLTYSYLTNMGESMLILSVSRYKHYNSMCEWINKLFPQFKLEDSDFIKFLACDGKTKCDSMMEMNVFDYIYLDMNLIDIDNIRHKPSLNKKYSYINDTYDELYIPDFLIKKIQNINLIKPLIIEFYGMYNTNINAEKMYVNYYHKTHRKEEYYKNNPDIYYIGLFPLDLKNNFQGVREKLTSFLLENNIPIPSPLKEVV